MRKARRLPLAAVAVALALVAGPGCLAANILDVVGQVSQASYSNYLNTSLFAYAGDNRGLGGADHDLARDNIAAAFLSFGLTPVSGVSYLEPFLYSGSTYYNVVGVQPGTVHPEEYYIVGAHYDSYGTPGADDNASGVAGVLEAARVLSQYDFEASLIFIAFDREEQGLIGSSAWAAAHHSDDIQGMVSLDMIAYNPVQGGSSLNQVAIYTVNGGDNSVTDGLLAAFAAYGGDVTASLVGAMGQSDHVPFYSRGFASALLIEKNVFTNPYYHTQSDSLNTGYLDDVFATSVTRATVGYLATQADLATPEPVPAVLTLSGLVVLVVALRRRDRRLARADRRRPAAVC